jgi:hypothetical protein
MKTIIITLLLIIISVPIHAQLSLNLTVSVNKNIFIEGELIDVGLSLQNVSSQIIHLSNSGIIRITLNDNQGIDYPYIGPSNDNFSPTKMEYKANEENYDVIELNRYFGTLLHFGNTNRYFKPGIYNLHVTYYLPKIQPITKTLTFQVNSPEGDEAIVYNKYKEANNLLATPQYSHLKFLNPLENIIREYPNSVYSPIILDILAVWYDIILKDFVKSKKYSTELVEKCSWSSRSGGALSYKLKELKSANARIEYLNKIEPNSKNSVTRKLITNLIKTTTAY